MRGKIRKRLLRSGKISLFIVYYPPVWNVQKKTYTRWEFLKLHIYPEPKTVFENLKIFRACKNAINIPVY